MNWQFPKHYRGLNQVGWRLLPGVIAALAAAGLLKLGALNTLERIAYNWLFLARGETAWDERVVIVAIDEASLKKIGRFPWPRQQYTRLLKQLILAEPGVAVFDIILPESSQDDSQLAAAMEQHGRVVLAAGWDNTGAPLQPNQQLQEAAIAIGHVLKRDDFDGVTRKVEPQIKGIPTLGIAAVQAYAFVQAPVQLPSLNRSLLLNWAGPSRQVPQYSFVEVVEGRVPPQQLRNKIILIGITATGFDPLRTPFERNPPATSVHLHATVIHNILRQNFLQVPRQNWTVLILLLGGPGLAFVLSERRTGQQLLLLMGLSAGWLLFSVLQFGAGYWVPLALPIVTFGLTGIAVAIGERLRESWWLRCEIDQLWRTYAPDLIFSASNWTGTELSYPHWHPQSSAMVRVTQLAALAEQLGRSQSTQLAISRSLSIGLVAVNPDGRVWFCNPVAADWLKVQVGHSIHDLLVPHWLSQADWQADLSQLRQRDWVKPREFHRGDRWFELKLEPLLYQPAQLALVSGLRQLDGWLLLLEDITARKQIEENLTRQMQELQQVSLLKDDFLSTVSHELRAPMANMKMAIHLLKVSPSPEQREHYLKILQSECDREVNLINDLLDLQRLEAGAKTLKVETLSLQDWLPQIIEPFYERAANRQQTLEIEIPAELPLLVSDSASLERLLVELLHNACKYAPPTGEIKLLVNAVPSQVELQVRNSGSEIPEAELPRIFEKFYRILKNDRWKQGGTGLGLALVKRLVEYLGGSIRVESGAGWTTFIVRLPITHPQVELSQP